MTLAQFIRAHIETILTEWQAFAASVPSAAGMDEKALRNDAREILLTIALDMESAQSGEEQAQKSKGRKPPLSALDTDATTHGSARFLEGFSLDEMVSEFRALRASVIKLWLQQPEAAASDRLYELTRFNEGIDQALTESIARFAAQLNHSRELFMGVLSHDLRTPLQVIIQSTRVLSKAPNEELRKQATVHIERSAHNIKRLVDDLLDVARSRLGVSMPLEAKPMDAGLVGKQLVDDLRALYPQREIRFEASGDLHGTWDSTRVSQLLSNLVRNAIQHGDSSSVVTVRAKGDGGHLLLEVHNFGEPIPATQLPHIFEPLTRATERQEAGGNHHMGLGLFIARTIAQAHGGTLTAQSSPEAGTLFSAALPRRASAPSGEASRNHSQPWMASGNAAPFA